MPPRRSDRVRAAPPPPQPRLSRMALPRIPAQRRVTRYRAARNGKHRPKPRLASRMRQAQRRAVTRRALQVDGVALLRRKNRLQRGAGAGAPRGSRRESALLRPVRRKHTTQRRSPEANAPKALRRSRTRDTRRRDCAVAGDARRRCRPTEMALIRRARSRSPRVPSARLRLRTGPAVPALRPHKGTCARETITCKQRNG